METNELINLLIAIGSLITSSIAIFTLLEIKKQRKESYKPDLTIRGNNFFVQGYLNNFKESCYKYYIPEYTQDSDLDINYEDGKTYRLKMINIGLHAAKDIQLSWEYNYKEAIDIITNSSSTNYYKIKEANGYLHVTDLDSKISKSGELSYKDKFDFLQSSSPGNLNEIKFPLPEMIMHLFICNWRTSVRNKKTKTHHNSPLFPSSSYDHENEIIDPPSLPNIILKIRYDDISGVTYKKKFALKLQYWFRSEDILLCNQPKFIGQFFLSVKEIK
jgi:hypothetical protein